MLSLKLSSAAPALNRRIEARRQPDSLRALASSGRAAAASVSFRASNHEPSIMKPEASGYRRGAACYARSAPMIFPRFIDGGPRSESETRPSIRFVFLKIERKSIHTQPVRNTYLMQRVIASPQFFRISNLSFISVSIKRLQLPWSCSCTLISDTYS